MFVARSPNRPATSRKAVTSKDTALPRSVMNSRRPIADPDPYGSTIIPPQTCALEGWYEATLMTGLGQLLPKWVIREMSVLPSIATEERTSRDVSNVPIGDIDYAVNLLSADHVGNFSGARLTQLAPFIRSCFIGRISYVAPTSSRIIGSAAVRRSTSVWSFAEKIDSPHPPLGSSTRKD